MIHIRKRRLFTMRLTSLRCNRSLSELFNYVVRALHPSGIHRNNSGASVYGVDEGKFPFLGLVRSSPTRNTLARAKWLLQLREFRVIFYAVATTFGR